jgi:hypothetical protein
MVQLQVYCDNTVINILTTGCQQITSMRNILWWSVISRTWQTPLFTLTSQWAIIITRRTTDFHFWISSTSSQKYIGPTVHNYSTSYRSGVRWQLGIWKNSFWTVIQLGIPCPKLWHLSRALSFRPDHWRHDLTSFSSRVPSCRESTICPAEGPIWLKSK